MVYLIVISLLSNNIRVYGIKNRTQYYVYKPSADKQRSAVGRQATLSRRQTADISIWKIYIKKEDINFNKKVTDRQATLSRRQT